MTGIVSGLCGGVNCIIQGCSTAVTPLIGSGYIFLNGEILKVDPHTQTNAFYVKTTTYDATGSKVFENGLTVDTYQKNRAVCTAASGTLKYNGFTLKEIASGRKIIEIGPWNMVSTIGLSISLSEPIIPSKVIGVNVFIQDDNNNGLYRLDSIRDIVGSGSGTRKEGGDCYIEKISGAYILVRYDDGWFNTTEFNSTAINRGYVIIDFIP
jgi:hypothetical protein